MKTVTGPKKGILFLLICLTRNLLLPTRFYHINLIFTKTFYTSLTALYIHSYYFLVNVFALFKCHALKPQQLHVLGVVLLLSFNCVPRVLKITFFPSSVTIEFDNASDSELL